MVSTGMSKVGYTYINLDAGWSGRRDEKGNIRGNVKFPDMKALADYVHSKGLKIGIHSSPGSDACSAGTYAHEEQDAKTYAAWGIDYLKYDWLCANRIYGVWVGGEPYERRYKSTREEYQGVYQKMGEALFRTGRPIVYSLCQYGLGEVWKWGTKVGGNLWRTTDDINDSWESMEGNGFSQVGIASYAQPGHWNDPDMLEIGNGGMTTDEYRTQMSLWSLLAAPLLASNDLRSMAKEIKEILLNPEVIAIDQDPEAKPVRQIAQEGKTEVLVRPLRDNDEENSVAVGLFNRGDQPAEVSVRWDILGLGTVTKNGIGQKSFQARDLWKHQLVSVTGDRYTATVPVHGVVLLRVSAVTRWPR
jgi:alpha-galactosidase